MCIAPSRPTDARYARPLRGELWLHGLRKEPGGRGASIELGNGLPDIGRSVQRVGVGIHREIAIELGAIQDETEAILLLQQGAHRLVAMTERPLDGRAEHPRDARDARGSESATDNVRAERQREPARLASPSRADIAHVSEPFLRVGKTTLVDEER